MVRIVPDSRASAKITEAHHWLGTPLMELEETAIVTG